MKKADLIRALDGLDSEIDVFVWVEQEGERDIERVSYCGAKANKDAFIYLIARRAVQQTPQRTDGKP